MSSSEQSISFEGANLPAVGLVSELNDEDRAMLSSYGQFGYVQAGTKIIRQSTPQDRLYFVISGSLHAQRDVDGHKMFLNTIRQGEWFGEINIFDPSAASATVSAVEAAQLWSIGRDDLLSYLGTYPEAAVRLLVGVATILSRRLRDIGGKLASHAQYENIISEIGK